MKTHPLLRTLSAIFGSLSLLTISESKVPSYTFSQDIDPLCSPTYDLNVPQGFCVFPAETYGTTIYQIAICKNNPLQSPTPDTSSCFFLYNNSSGQYIDIANYVNSGFILNTLDKAGRPPSGDYNYLYGLFSNRVNIKGTVRIQQGTYYTTNTPNPNHHEGALASAVSSSYSVFDSPIWSETDDNGNLGCFDNSSGISYLDSNGQPTIFNSPICTGAAKIAMAGTTQQLLGSTLRITDDVKGLDMKFGASIGLGIYNSFQNKVIDFQGFDFTLDLLR